MIKWIGLRGEEDGLIVLVSELAGSQTTRAAVSSQGRLGARDARTPDGWRDRFDVRQGKAGRLGY